ncbi:MAG: PAS domain S-box protein, partial [Planctomycetaceae bacterium]|nr:PAS domain S-box protein [Planctomycetaceae bacterium]
MFWDDPELRHAETLEVVRTGVSRLGSLETYAENGERRWASVDKVPTRDPGGTITGVLVFIRDITDQRRAEIALEERNRFIERVSALTPNLMYVFDFERMQPVYTNRPASVLLGFDDPQAHTDFTLADHMHPDDLATVMTRMHGVAHLADGQITEFSYRLRQRDGSYRWMMSRAMPFERHTDGTVRLVVGMSIDITSLKETEAALRNMVQRNDALLQAMPDLMFLISAENKFVDFHCPETAILAMPPERFLGRDVAEVISPEIVAGLEKARHSASSDRLVHSFEYTMDLGGQSRQFEARVVACGIDQTLVIARDITERMQAETALRESEARFRQFADGIDHVIWMASPAMDTTIFVNRAYETIFGRSRDEMLAQPTDWMRAVYTDDRPRVSEAMSKIRSGPQRSEFRILRPDGSLRWLRGLGLPILSESGEIYMFAGIFEDITAAKASAE